MQLEARLKYSEPTYVLVLKTEFPSTEYLIGNI